jgi:hypothetical protein
VSSGPDKRFKLRHLLGALGVASGLYVLSNRPASEVPAPASQPAAAPIKSPQMEREVPASRASIKLAQLSDALSARNLEASKNIFRALTPDETEGLDLEQFRKRIAILQRQYDTLMTEVQNQIRTGRWDEAKSGLNSMARMSPSDPKLTSLNAEIDEKMAKSDKSMIDSSSLSSTLKALENTREP